VPSLANRFLEFALDANTALWSLRPAGAEFPALRGVRVGFALRDPGGQRLKWEGAVYAVEVSAAERVDTRHGPASRLVAALRPAGPGLTALELVVEFVLPEAHPGLHWRLHLRNRGEGPFRLRELELAVVGSRLGFSLQPPVSALHLHPEVGHLAFFSNGYQSWSFTGALQAGMTLPLSRFNWLEGPKFLNLRNPVVNGLGHFTSDMFAVLGDRTHNTALVAGFLAQREQFGHLEALVVDARSPYLRLAAHGDDVPVPSGGERVTDWAYAGFIQPDAPDPLAEYLEAVARENAARVPVRTPVGWCSWYHYYDRVTERDILSNLSAIERLRDRLPLDFVQLDDGYQAQVGDWFETKPTFPHGLAWLAARIQSSGCTPGLWLAPYIVRSDAQLNRRHPEWFLRDARGRRVSAGFNWLRWCYALDPTHPGVREHTQRLIQTAVQEWGFPYLKLDFLYAAALPGRRYDATLTRAQAMRLALEDIRAAAGPDTFLLGCGCPLGPAVGIVDGMRISTDVAPNWNPELLAPMFSRWVESELGFVSARNAVQNIISRAPLHRRWWLNDPDCLLVRDEASRLTEAEVRSLATVIALSGGMFLVSDDLTRLNPERYRYIAALLPVLQARAHARGWLAERTPDTLTLPLLGAAGEWLVLGIFNWGELPHTRRLDPVALGLPPAPHFVADFWDNVVTRLEAGQPLVFRDMPPHSAHLVTVRPATNGPALVSSSFHFSQGAEVAWWEAAEGRLSFRIELGRVSEGEMQLALPAPPRSASVEGRPVEAVPAGLGLYSLAFTVEKTAEVTLTW